MNARALPRRERARRQIVVTLAELGENVLDRERAAAAIVAALDGIGIPLDDPRFVAGRCSCITPDARPGVHDTATGRHYLFSRPEIARRIADRWNAIIADDSAPSRVYSSHEARA